MHVYIQQIEPNGSIILKKNIIDLDKFNVTTNEHGDIVLNKKQIIKIKKINELKNYNYAYSKILLCNINNNINNEISNLKYNNILKQIYNLIGDGTTIIRNSSINIKTTVENTKGFEYMENIGISYQGIDSNKCIVEIITQCVKNNILINIKIRLSDGNELKLLF